VHRSEPIAGSIEPTIRTIGAAGAAIDQWWCTESAAVRHQAVSCGHRLTLRVMGGARLASGRAGLDDERPAAPVGGQVRACGCGRSVRIWPRRWPGGDHAGGGGHVVRAWRRQRAGREGRRLATEDGVRPYGLYAEARLVGYGALSVDKGACRGRAGAAYRRPGPTRPLNPISFCCSTATPVG
jgi:hypothetical protein